MCKSRSSNLSHTLSGTEIGGRTEIKYEEQSSNWLLTHTSTPREACSKHLMCKREWETKKKKKSRDLVELRRPGFVEPGSKFNNAAALLEKWCREIRQSARTALWVTFHYTVKEMSLYFTHCVWSNKSNYGSCPRVWRCCEWWEKKWVSELKFRFCTNY